MEIETESRFTLIYGNRTGRVDDVPRTSWTSSSRATPTGSRSSTCGPAIRGTRRELRGRIDRAKLERWLAADLRAGHRGRMVPVRSGRAGDRSARDTLDRARRRAGAHPPGALLRLRQKPKRRQRHYQSAATVTFTLSGRAGDVDLDRRRHDPRGARCRPAATPPTPAWAAPAAPAGRSSSDGTVEMDQNFALGERRPRRRLRPDLPVAPDQLRRSPSTTTHKETEMASRTTASAPKAPQGWLQQMAARRTTDASSFCGPNETFMRYVQTRSSTFCATSR